MQKILETERLRLVPSHPGLAAEVCAFYRRNREFLLPTESERADWFYEEDYQRRELREYRKEARKGLGFRYWIFKKGEGAVIGMTGLSTIVMGAFCSCFLSYKIDRDELCRGYAAEAVERLIRFGFGELGLHRIEANILPGNEASLALAKKLGFKEEGRSPKYLKVCGVWEEHIHMVLLNEELE